MKVQDYLDYLEDAGDRINPGDKPKKAPKSRKHNKHDSATLVQPGAPENTFHPTFTGSQHEEQWILTYLGGFYEDGVITDVLRQVKGGKEAQVYCCAAGPATGVELIAAKLYRPRMFRNLRNDWIYRQGRDVTDGAGHGAWGRRQLTAIKKRTEFGQELLHMSWLGNELVTMQLLYEAGVDLPRPIASSDNAILMEYVGDLSLPAPALYSVDLDRAEARSLFERTMHNIETMLANGRVHGDLSAHNILYWEGDIKIIDFPQAVDPIINEDSYAIFARDVLRVCQYFSRFGVQSDPASLARDMWRAYLPE